MCRWAAYHGPEVFLEDIVTAPCHSLINQSHHALEGKTPINGDGFGIAWYGERPEPGAYRDILPAWSDPNLKSLCRQIRSKLFLAHVRASTGGATSRANCHPFTAGKWSFMHNGQIGAFERIRRPLEMALPDDLYDQKGGTTDSELFFLTMLAEGLDHDPQGALSRATARVHDAARRAGVSAAFKLTAAFADGERLYAVRYASEGNAPSLYLGDVSSSGGRCIVSEPFDQTPNCWTAVPTGSLVTISAAGVTMRPFAPAAGELALSA